jgi:hypothetical protein
VVTGTGTPRPPLAGRASNLSHRRRSCCQPADPRTALASPPRYPAADELKHINDAVGLPHRPDASLAGTP